MERTNLLVLPIRAADPPQKIIQIKRSRPSVVEMSHVLRRKFLHKTDLTAAGPWTPEPLPAA